MLEKYLNFTKNKPSPFLGKEASVILRNAYLFMRINIKKNIRKNQGKYFSVGIKQLESLIKISESLGRMKISNFISADEVFEAVRLFQKRFFI
jgi:DNA replication licensing factor MCM5